MDFRTFHQLINSKYEINQLHHVFPSMVNIKLINLLHQEIFLGVNFCNITYLPKTFEICIKFRKIS